MTRRLFHGQLADETAGEDRPRAERLRRLARELIAIVREALIRDGQVRIHGFGTFHLRRTRAHKGVNPQTGERIDIPERNRVLFRPAKALRERVEPGGTPAVPLAEPHASREAVLGGVMSDAPAAGALPVADDTDRRRHYFPDRIAAAAMADSVARASGPGPARVSTVSGSREANLGGAMGDSPSAGQLPPGDSDGDDEAVRPAVDAPPARAANDATERAGAPSREAALGTAGSVESPAAGALPADDLPPEAQEPDRPATVPVTRSGPAPVASDPDEAGVELDPGASREAGLTRRGGSGHAAGELPPETDEAADQASGFEAGAPLREDAPGAARATRELEPAGLRESALADGGAAARPAGELPDADPPWDSQPAEPTRREPVPSTREGPRTPPRTEPPAARPEGSREAVLGGSAGRAGAAGALPGEAEPDSEAGADWVARPEAPRPGRIMIDDDVESGRVPPPEEETEARADRRDARGPLVLLLLLLLAALAWWFWPRAEEPVTPVADSGVTSERTDTVVTDAPEPGGSAADTAGTESAATAAPDESAGTEGAVEPAQGAETVEPAETAATAATAGTAETAAATETTGTTETAETAEAPAVADGTAERAVADAVIAGEDGASAATAGSAAASDTEAAVESATVAAAEPTGTAAVSGPSTAWFSGRSHAVRPGDTLWDLSDEHYVNPYYWPHIWNHNASLADPDVIEIDQDLWLPTLEGEPRSLTATDRRSIAEGYLRLYRRWQATGAANPQYALVGVRYFDPAVLPPELKNDPSAGRPNDTLAAAFEAQLQAEFPRQR